MARILGVDYGQKRTGLSVTDPLQIIVSALDTVETVNLRDYLREYFTKETVEEIAIGLPTHKDGAYTYLKEDIDNFAGWLRNNFKTITITFVDESYSSMDAKEVIFNSGAKKKKRKEKGLVDKISAVIILQRYLKHI